MRSWWPCRATRMKRPMTVRSRRASTFMPRSRWRLTLEGCDRLIAGAGQAAGRGGHVGFQRRSNPRFREGVELIRRGELGPLVEVRASWTSSNGPVAGHGGWLGRRERSGDWMVEQAVHIWDVLHWLKGELPVQASGWGRRGLFTAIDPARDVTDHYAVDLEWADGFRALVPPELDRTGRTTVLRVARCGYWASAGASISAPASLTLPRPAPTAAGRSKPALRPTRGWRSRRSSTAIRTEDLWPPPMTLADARAATQIGLLARKAVDERRVVTMDEIHVEDQVG